MGKSRQTEQKYSVDNLATKTAARLIRDFQCGLQDYSFCCSFLASLLAGSVAEIRESTPAVDFKDGSGTFEMKARYQLQSIFKRHRFENDTYSDSELTEKAVSAFEATQHRLRQTDLRTCDAEIARVIRIARNYVAHVLGPYSDEECRERSRFGRKASVGVPAALACEAARWELPISGSQDQINWFDAEMYQIDSVQEYWARQREAGYNGPTYQLTKSLKLTLVPKTFKSLRTIMPNTTIGGYMSYGLGEMMRVRLLRKGYDLRKLQHKHRNLAQIASRSDTGDATCDLSAASDTISVQLIEMLFPQDWFDVLTSSRIGQIELPDGRVVESLTFGTMGIGYTFPMQTLVFLSLLKAIQWVHYPKYRQRHISVYGDDLIYQSSMHTHVVRIFNKVGFVINIEKSYHDGWFRESCGGDYFRGVDVRPFQPQNGSVNFVGTKAYEATLYKTINGLLRRWHECEIGGTLQYLLSEVESLGVLVKRVPDDFPDDAGVRCPQLDTHDFMRTTAAAPVKFLGHGVYRFSYLRLVPEDRKEERHDPYLWLAMRGGPDNAVEQHSQWSHSSVAPTYIVRNIHDVVGLPSRVSPLITRDDKPICLIRSKLRGRRLRRQSTYVTISHSGRYTRQSGMSCFGSRR